MSWNPTRLRFNMEISLGPEETHFKLWHHRLTHYTMPVYAVSANVTEESRVNGAHYASIPNHLLTPVICPSALVGGSPSHRTSKNMVSLILALSQS